MRNESLSRVGMLLLGSSLLGLLSSCNGGNLFQPTPGEYSGFLNSQSVSAKLTQSSARGSGGQSVPQYQLNLNGTGISQLWSVEIGSNGVTLTTPSGTENFSAPQSGDTDCMTSNQSGQAGGTKFDLCVSADEIHWDQTDASGAIVSKLDLTRNLSDEMPTLETPQSYSLSDLITRAKSHNFQSVVEFQKVMIAQDNALTADLDLLPHANTTDLLNFLSGNIYTELKSVGDLVPFLLPGRWFRAAGTNDLLSSEKDAWQIMDLDGVQYTEGFAYGIAREEAVFIVVQNERTMIASLRDFIRGKELGGLVQVGTSDDLSSLINKIDEGNDALKSELTNELAALAATAGFYNPGAITDVTFSPDPNSPSAAHPLTIDFNSAAALAESRSVELRQMDDLIAWAKMSRDARVFDWLDPSGDTSGGIGAGLPSYIEAGADQVNQMLAQKQEVQAQLLNKLQTVITQLNQSAADYALASQGIDIQNRRVERVSENLKVGVGFVMSDLTSALQDQMSSQTAQLDSEFGYQISMSRLNRILYQGNYAPVAP